MKPLVQSAATENLEDVHSGLQILKRRITKGLCPGSGDQWTWAVGCWCWGYSCKMRVGGLDYSPKGCSPVWSQRHPGSPATTSNAACQHAGMHVFKWRWIAHRKEPVSLKVDLNVISSPICRRPSCLRWQMTCWLWLSKLLDIYSGTVSLKNNKHEQKMNIIFF